MCDLLWSDPDDRCGWGISPRGAGAGASAAVRLAVLPCRLLGPLGAVVPRRKGAEPWLAKSGQEAERAEGLSSNEWRSRVKRAVPGRNNSSPAQPQQPHAPV